MPAGVLSVVTGAAEDAPAIGGELTSNPLVRKLGFTGSTEVGKLLMAQCAPGLKKISLELGGNAPFIVFDDADLDEAVAGAITCKFRNSGQTCISANRMLVQEGVYDDFLARFTEAVRELKVGGRVRRGRQRRAADRRACGREGRAARRGRDGARCRGRRRRRAASRGSSSSRPCSSSVTRTMAMSCEETFGPVAGIARFSTEDEAVRIANDTPYGLAAYFYSQGLGRVGPRRRGARVRDRRHQHRAHLDRGRAVRRREGVRDRPRGLVLRDRRVARSCKYWAIGGIEGPVIVEQRDYHVYTGKLPELRAPLRGRRGSRSSRSILGGLVGAFTTDDRRARPRTRTLWRYD